MKTTFLVIALCLFGQIQASEGIRRLTVKDGLPNNQIRQIVELPNGQMLVATEGMFSLFNGQEFVTQSCNLDSVYPLPVFGAHDYLWQGDSLLWLKDFHSLYLYDTRKRAFRYDYGKMLHQSRIQKFIHENGDTVTKAKVVALAPLRAWADSLTRGTQLEGEWLQTYCRDPQGGHWLGIQNGGIAYVRPRHPEARIITIADDVIRKMAPIDDEHILVAGSSGIYLFSCRELKVEKVLVKGQTNCTDIATDARGRVWISTQLGLYCYDHGQLTNYDTSNTTGFVHHHVRFALPLDDGRILVCNLIHHLGYLYPGQRRFVLLNDKLPQLDRYRTMITACQLDKRNEVAVCTQNGLFVLDTEKDDIHELAPVEKYSRYSHKYNCILRDRQGRLWIGTQNGLICVQGEESHILTPADGLPSPCIKSLAEDTAGRLWAGTANGISRISLNTQANNQMHWQTFTLTTNDGLPPVEMTERGTIIMPDGTAFFATPVGLAVFRTTDFDAPRTQLNVALVGIRVKDTEQTADTLPLRLSHSQNYIELSFSALNYATPEHTRYRYRLSGLDTDWQTVSDGRGIATVRYNALRPGSYTFLVEAALEGGTWGKTTCKRITILPSPWLTWWAKLLYILMALSAGAILLNLYLQRKREKMERDYEMKVDKLFELHEEARRQFADSTRIAPEKIKATHMEDALIARMTKAIAQNMDNTNYSVDQLARDIGMSRANLYKKLQSALGITPNDFIRNVRLKRAAQLLLETDEPVNQIALMVGFQAPRYFSQCFRNVFGMTPSEYRNGRKDSLQEE